MQAHKVKGKIDAAGNLVIAEAVKMPPGDVEVIILQAEEKTLGSTETTLESQPETPKGKTKIQAFHSWFEKTQPASPDFDSDQSKWEYLKEKYDL